jgi:hypothetical protein
MTFSLTSDDGSNQYIDGELVVDSDGIHSTRERSGTVRLTRGVHKIRCRFALVLKFAPQEEHYRIFNTDQLKTPPGP